MALINIKTEILIKAHHYTDFSVDSKTMDISIFTQGMGIFSI